jgi:L-aspartate oxidase
MMEVRYITNFDSDKIEKEKVDITIIGAGIAGLYTALMLPTKYSILILSKKTYQETNSYKAQGGIACVMNEEIDSIESHIEDTLICGKNENSVEAVEVLINEAQQNIKNLMDLGVEFEKDENGVCKLSREGAHSVNRILYLGDYTGKSIMEVLYKNVLKQHNIRVEENAFAIDLLTKNNKCLGVLYEKNKVKKICYSEKTIIATGGIGKIFLETTNSTIATGDGIAMAYRAGAQLKNMSYIQYHPTVFYNKENVEETFLISEAVRGAHAIIRNKQGVPIMEKVHPLKDLAPRDVVSKAIFTEIHKQKEDEANIYLDVTMHKSIDLKNRFPFIFESCLKYGYDMGKDYIPIIPMMHYFMGGINVNLDGQTSVDNLYACGECSHTGVHGANRLASNSLLEAIVFGNRISKNIESQVLKDNEENYLSHIYHDKKYAISENKVKELGKKLNEFFISLKDEKIMSELKLASNQCRLNIVEEQTELDMININKFTIINKIVDDIRIGVE